MAASHRHLHRRLAGYFLLTGRCHRVSAASGSSVCMEARSGTCVRYAEETTRKAQTAETCADANQGRIDNCKMGKCNVAIGGSQYCSQCSAAAEYLIDGACVHLRTLLMGRALHAITATAYTEANITRRDKPPEMRPAVMQTLVLRECVKSAHRVTSRTWLMSPF